MSLTQSHANKQASYIQSPKLCKLCQIPIEYKKRFNLFCSSSHAAIWRNTNTLRTTFGPPPIFANNCKRCDVPIKNRYRYCIACSPVKGRCKVSDQTLKQATYSSGKSASAYGRIRLHAKYILKEREHACQHCGYSKHVEVCHIRAIKAFSADTLISEINNKSNLILLCPNCHWEHDCSNQLS